MGSRRKRSRVGPIRPTRPQNWWTSRSESARLERKFFLSRSVKDLRHFFPDFDASHGYDLRDIPTWSPQKLKRITEHARYLHQLQEGPYKIVRPRSARSKRILRKATGQHAPKQKAFLYKTPKPEATRIRITRSGKLEEERQVKGAKLVQRYYPFADYGEHPVTFAEMLDLTKEMLPQIPKGQYQLWTPRGPIEAAQDRDMLPRLLQKFVMGRYGGRGLEAEIVGFLFHGTRAAADLAARRLQHLRNERAKRRAAVKKQQRSFVRFYRSPRRKK